ncbi:MAG: VCBS repeat-containing protein, partial [Planctomycetes bacterium]|nr:VCBS repeat-containing protein [Planctomycetota bacterium]
MLAALLLAIPPTCVALQADAEPAWRQYAVEIPGDGTRLALRDVNGDGRADLVEVGPDGFRIALQQTDGGFDPGARPLFAWPSSHLAWCLADLSGDGVIELVTLSAAGEVTSYSAGDDGFGAGRSVLKSQSYLPHGVNRMGFARDVDVDGRLDLVLPGSGKYRIHLQREDGTFADALEIAFDVDVQYRVGDPESLDATFGQTLRVPWFRIEDVDGDGTKDLVSRTEERVDFHFAQPTLSATPTWSLDLEELAKSIPKREGVDLDNLLANIDLGVQYTIEELDGKAPRDLVLQLGGTVKVYLGGSAHGVQEQPNQVLKISGNLLGVLVRDTDGDDQPDLQLLRGDKVSLGRVLRWLILPGSLDFEFFTYKNTNGEFSRKPTRRNTVSLQIPRLLSLLDEVEELEDEIDRQQSVPARRIDLTGDGARNDVVDIEGGELLFFADCAPSEDEDKLRGFRTGDMEQAMRDLVLDDLDRMEDGETKVIDIGDLDTWTYSPGAALRASR